MIRSFGQCSVHVSDNSHFFFRKLASAVSQHALYWLVRLGDFFSLQEIYLDIHLKQRQMNESRRTHYRRHIRLSLMHPQDDSLAWGRI